MRRLGHILASVGVLLFCLPVAAGQAGPAYEPLELSICKLAKQPENYTGKMVVVRGSVSKGWRAPPKAIKELSISEPWSVVSCPGVVVTVVFPEAVQPKPDFDLQEDDAFRKLEKALRQRTHIEGTFEGRFDSVFVLKDRKRIRVGKGFGHRHRATMRLVLRKVYDLEIRPVPPIDR